MNKIFYYFKSFKKELIISFCLIFISAFIASCLPLWEGKFIIEKVRQIALGKNSFTTKDIIFLLVLTLLFYIVVAILRIFYNKLLVTSIHKGIKYLRQDIQKKIHLLPVSYFEQNTLGNIMSRMTNDIEIISNSLQQTCSTLIYSSFFIIASSFWMFSINWRLGLIVILVIPLSFFTIYKLSKKSQNIFIQRFETFGDYNGFLQEKYTGYKEIMIYNQQSKVIKEFQIKNNNLQKLIFKSNILSGLLMPIIKSFTYLIVVLVSVLGSFLMSDSNNQITLIFMGSYTTLKLGIFQAFIKYVWCLESPISELTQMSVLFQSAKAASQRVFRFLQEEEESPESEQPFILNNFKNKVVFDNVSFSYGTKIILQNINFEVKCGQMIAIVGPTGSGKSTLINLLMRFYDLEKGSITIDGININNFKKDNLRKIFGMVLQDTWLFNGTIFENIKYGNNQATDEEVFSAAKKANINLFIDSKTNGYYTMINEESDNLSQGEKQMITIARTILRNPSILILDEATSTIDTRTELLLQQAIKKLLNDRTSFVIAHRLSTIINADKILFLRDGKIEEIGNHQELLSKKGFYYQLYQSQFKQI
ncbi:Multidrug efflux pump, ATP-binding and permease protein [Candidatus Phytoplasma mali]|uniref:Multidrug efflux pump, ATP-binding and permease protein n=1 Tax=Phytoplasma mali (strain AT) TaxID=482235 RepID=B3R0D3_PHYMT|nr:ABC transporter ATP-binding protein [Candidatus Phytoplasma mali]CAP18297.1 Multidrug efflux pump, ATP-binding and permease protein [Candidatus Phytoplasma mali]